MMYKEASPFLALGRLGLKALGKTTRFGGKAALFGAKKVVKNPGTAFMAALTPSWVGGYTDTARTQTLSTMKRKLPKFASEEREYMQSKYPEYLYKIAGFEKMAADADAARKVVKKAFKLKMPSFLKPQFKHRIPYHEFVKDTKWHDDLLGKGWDTVSGKIGDKKIDIEKRIGMIRDLHAKLQASAKKRSFGEALRDSVAEMNTGAVLGTALVATTPVAILTEKLINKKMEKNKLDRSYRNMMYLYPELRREKPDEVKRYFDYISTYSPTVAQNPHAVGALAQRFVRGGQSLMDYNVIEGLLKVEKTKSQVASSRDHGSPAGNAIKQIASQVSTSVM